MTAIITLTTAGADTGPFNIFSNADGFVNPFELNISKGNLLAGFISENIPNTATVIRVQSIGSCTNSVNINLPPPVIVLE